MKFKWTYESCGIQIKYLFDSSKLLSVKKYSLLKDDIFLISPGNTFLSTHCHGMVILLNTHSICYLGDIQV